LQGQNRRRAEVANQSQHATFARAFEGNLHRRGRANGFKDQISTAGLLFLYLIQNIRSIGPQSNVCPKPDRQVEPAWFQVENNNVTAARSP
jgi:hypothetical protein